MRIFAVFSLLGLAIAHPIVEGSDSTKAPGDFAVNSARDTDQPAEAVAAGLTSVEELLAHKPSQSTASATDSPASSPGARSAKPPKETNHIGPSPGSSNGSLIPNIRIGEDAKINGKLTPLARFIVKNSEHLMSEYCYQALVQGKDLRKSMNFPVQDCIYVKNAQVLRAKAPHKGQFWFSKEMGRHCFNTLKRQPCVVDLRVDTGCGWPSIKKFQGRCKKFPNWGVARNASAVNAKDLSWLVPDIGDQPARWLDFYYNYGGKGDGTGWTCGDGC